MKVQFDADIKNLPAMIAFIRDQAQGCEFEAGLLHSIELACEEALVNIIKHGFSAHKGYIVLACSSLSQKYFEISISDNGIPFNPLENIKVPPNKAKVESQQLGGYGIYLILNLMDKVEYHRKEGLNTLVLVKHTQRK